MLLDMARDELMTIQEAAAETGLTESAVRNAIYRGRLSTVEKYGRKLLPRNAFERYRSELKMGRPAKKP
jgi:DNA-directed RNA polymerase specialized sigma24 family protein